MINYIFTFVLLSVLNIGKAEIPSYIHVCKKSDPHIEDCIVSSVEKLRPRLVKGIPELEIPALEPLHLPEIAISRGPNFHSVGTDVIVHGASNFKITKLKADINKLVFNIGIEIPYLLFDATYDVDLKILTLPIKGRGPIKANATDVEGDAVLKGHKIKQNGETYVLFDSLNLKLNISNYNVHLGNLFGGDKALGDAINVALNENKRDLMRAVAPVAEKVTADVLLDIANKITKHFPYKDLFPEE